MNEQMDKWTKQSCELAFSRSDLVRRYLEVLHKQNAQFRVDSIKMKVLKLGYVSSTFYLFITISKSVRSGQRESSDMMIQSVQAINFAAIGRRCH